jgi:hypothetical protein
LKNFPLTDLFLEKLLKQDQGCISMWKNEIEKVVLRNGLIQQYIHINQWFVKHNLDPMIVNYVHFLNVSFHREFDYDSCVSLIDGLSFAEIQSIKPKTKFLVASVALCKNDFQVIEKLLSSNFTDCVDLFSCIIHKIEFESEISKQCLSLLWQKTKLYQDTNWEYIIALGIKRRLLSLLDWIYENKLYDFQKINTKISVKSKMFTTWIKFKQSSER